MNRRQFSKTALMASAMIPVKTVPGWSHITFEPVRSIRKSMYWGSVGTGNTILEKFKATKAAGFDGIEVMSHFDRSEVLKARDTTGLLISSVCGAMYSKFPLSDPDPLVREKGVEALMVTIDDAKAYGADAILVVPGRVTETVRYDECWNRSIEELRKVIPYAETANVKIAIENVWNNFLLSPIEAAGYVDQFNSSMVGFYFDCGNILAYGWPEQWIKILGRRIVKVHIKEYSHKIADTQGRYAGFNANLGEGDVNWPAVMKALDETGYKGWATIEQDGGDTQEGLKDLCDRLVKILES